MTSKIDIRSETNDDIGPIAEVTVAAFQTLEISNHTEQFIIEALRAAKVLTLSLVAVIDGRVIGHIAFSPVTISDGTQDWYGLGPVSRDHFGRHTGLVRTWTCFGLAEIPTSGHW
jgi:putative acetyltransferase